MYVQTKKQQLWTQSVADYIPFKFQDEHSTVQHGAVAKLNIYGGVSFVYIAETTMYMQVKFSCNGMCNKNIILLAQC